MRFRVCIERGRPFVGVAAAKQSMSSLLDPSNTAQLEQKILAAKKMVVVSRKTGAHAMADADDVDIDKLSLRMSSVSECADMNDPTDCMAILQNFQVGMGWVPVQISCSSSVVDAICRKCSARCQAFHTLRPSM